MTEPEIWARGAHFVIARTAAERYRYVRIGFARAALRDVHHGTYHAGTISAKPCSRSRFFYAFYVAEARIAVPQVAPPPAQPPAYRTYWRKRNDVAYADNERDAFLLQQDGFVQTDSTYPAINYYAPPDYNTPVTARRWAKLTGRPVCTRGEFCLTCGRHKTECAGHKRRGGITTTAWRTDGKPTRPRYFMAPDGSAVGLAGTLEHEYAYRKAGWIHLMREKSRVRRMSIWARCTISGPDRTVSAKGFRAVLDRNKHWQDIPPEVK
jgi:hypothetical protein